MTVKSAVLKSNIFAFVSVIFLFLPLGNFVGYRFTVGTAAAMFLLLVSLPGVLRTPHHLLILALAWFIPIIIYAGHILFQTTYALPSGDFFKSYLLWDMSALVIWLAFQDRPKFSQANWTAIFVIVVGFGTLQYLDAHYGSRTLVRLVESLNIYNPLNYGTAEQTRNVAFRAIGTYYEPSMFGRVAGTLAAIVLVTRRRLVLVAIGLGVALYVSRSLSLFVLGAGTYVLLYARASWQALILVAFGFAATLIFGDFIVQRMSFSSGTSQTSTFIRLGMPLVAIREILPAYPFGVPIGSNEVIVQNVIATHFANYERKITNGLYEFILLFGFPALGLLAWLFGKMVKAWFRRDEQKVIMIFFLIFSTAASGSYLSVESALLLYFLIATLRRKVPR